MKDVLEKLGIKICPSYPNYGATRDGRVFRVTPYPRCRPVPFELKRRYDGDGYLLAGLNVKVHRMVADAYIPNPENKPQVAHDNGVRDQNNVENLKWATCVENFADKRRHGTQTSGDTCTSSKLSSGQVAFYRGLARRGIPHSKIALISPVDRSVISRAIKGTTWQSMQF